MSDFWAWADREKTLNLAKNPRVAAMVKATGAEWTSTGGGCQGYIVKVPKIGPDAYLLITNEANLPEDGMRVHVGLYGEGADGGSLDGFEEDDGRTTAYCFPTVETAMAFILVFVGVDEKNAKAVAVLMPDVHTMKDCKNECFGVSVEG